MPTVLIGPKPVATSADTGTLTGSDAISPQNLGAALGSSTPNALQEKVANGVSVALRKYFLPPSGDLSGAEDSAAANAIIALIKTSGIIGAVIELAAARYYFSSRVLIDQTNIKIRGQGMGVTSVIAINSNAFEFALGVNFGGISSMSIAHSPRYTITSNSSKAITVFGGPSSHSYWHEYDSLFIDGFQFGFDFHYVGSASLVNCYSVYVNRSVTYSGICLNNSIEHCGFAEDSPATAGSYAIRFGNGAEAQGPQGLFITDTLTFGHKRALWIHGGTNVNAIGNIFDFNEEYGVYSEQSTLGGSFSHYIKDNYLGFTGAALGGVMLQNTFVDPFGYDAGSRVCGNQIVAYQGSSVNYGIYVGGSAERNNIISDNYVKNAFVYDCQIAAGTGHKVTGNSWSGNGFYATVPLASYLGNNGTVVGIWPSSIGIFTPFVLGSSVAGSATYTLQYGSYKVIDGVLDFRLSVKWTGHTGTGALRIGGLPTNSKVYAQYEGSAITVLPELISFPPGATSLGAFVQSGQSTIEFRGVGNALAVSGVLISADGQMSISGSYEI